MINPYETAERRAFQDSVSRLLEAEIWMHPGMTTYYRNSKGRVYSVMPWRLVDYWNMTRAPDLDDFETYAS